MCIHMYVCACLCCVHVCDGMSLSLSLSLSLLSLCFCLLSIERLPCTACSVAWTVNSLMRTTSHMSSHTTDVPVQHRRPQPLLDARKRHAHDGPQRGLVSSESIFLFRSRDFLMSSDLGRSRAGPGPSASRERCLRQLPLSLSATSGKTKIKSARTRSLQSW